MAHCTAVWLSSATFVLLEHAIVGLERRLQGTLYGGNIDKVLVSTHSVLYVLHYGLKRVQVLYNLDSRSTLHITLSLRKAQFAPTTSLAGVCPTNVRCCW